MSAWEDCTMKIKVTSQTFDDERRINESNVRLNDTVEEKGKWPCNSILCTVARKWIYERCTGIVWKSAKSNRLSAEAVM